MGGPFSGGADQQKSQHDPTENCQVFSSSLCGEEVFLGGRAGVSRGQSASVHEHVVWSLVTVRCTYRDVPHANQTTPTESKKNRDFYLFHLLPYSCVTRVRGRRLIRTLALCGPTCLDTWMHSGKATKPFLSRHAQIHTHTCG